MLTKQTDWILTTKLNPPLIRADIVGRPHLLQRLEHNLQRTLTLIAAPAGYGKSTLAAQWLASSSLPGVWVSLDEGDSDVRVFLSYIVAAVRRLVSDACPRLFELLDAPQLPPVHVLARLLLNDLETLGQPFLLVLDDYHLINDPDVSDIVDRLLQHPPRCLHLVILTRRDPLLPLVSMKARAMAMEIREADLQFDSIETGQVLQRVGNISLDAESLEKVMEEIEGWITGLRLFCLAMEKGDDPKLYLFGISGGALHVQEYLVEQVLSRQPEELQSCLLKTSILDRFCASLCEAVCKKPSCNVGGEQFLAHISDAKLFGIQLEPGGKWVRYHHLFRDLLQGHLVRTRSPEEIAALHRKAALWFSEQGLIEEGLKHAFAASDSELAADIIENARLEALNTDKWPRLATWLDALPAGVENARPNLLVSRAYVLMQSMRIAEIPAVMDRVLHLENGTPFDPMIVGELAFFRGIIAFFMGDVASCKTCFYEALATTPETNLECRAEGEYFSYVAEHLDGHSELAVQKLKAAVQRNHSRSLFYQTRLVFGLSLVHSLAGQWPEARSAAEYLAEFSRPNDLSYALAWAVYMQGIASLQMGEFKHAERFFTDSIAMCYIKNRQAAVDAFAGQALCLQFQGRDNEADVCLQEVRNFAYWTGVPALLDLVDSCRARVALLRGDNDAAIRWESTHRPAPVGPVKLFFLEISEITVCRVLVARGTKQSLAEAASRLADIELESRRFHHSCHLLPVLVLQSVLAGKQKQLKRALNILAEAINLAWAGYAMLPFLEGGAPVAVLLLQLPEHPEWGHFVPDLLARINPVKQSPSVADKSITEELTNRENDVVMLLCERLYDKEIAERLGISTATVKTHLAHIYGKLGVSNRREAARKAKQLSLV